MARTAKTTDAAAEKKVTKRTKKADAVEKKVTEAAAEVKAETSETEAKAEEKAPAKKTAAKRTTAKKTAVKSTVYMQFAGREFTESELLEAVKESYVSLGNKAEDIRTIDVYVKPEECAAYYVVNGEGSDEFKIEL